LDEAASASFCLNGAPENQPPATVRDLAESLSWNY